MKTNPSIYYDLLGLEINIRQRYYIITNKILKSINNSYSQDNNAKL